MFFTKAGRIAAWIATVVALMSIALGYAIGWGGTDSVLAEAFRIDSPQKAVAQSKLSLSQGYALLFCGLVLGILSEISESIAGRTD
ncbi:hypothetical protein [Tabrizicola caldifontis]|uniref:hypothetical protein n=1 Tax=Tabrizicola caldifontis TaxID=2528036 RepID=UPI001436A59F|nr:hypothetical protein [Rhodobacter sp. YIM 73028]